MDRKRLLFNPRLNKLYILIGLTLLSLVFVLASINAYEGASARKLREYEHYTSQAALLAVRLDLETAIAGAQYVQYAVILLKTEDSYAVDSIFKGKKIPTARSPLTEVYPDITPEMLDSVARVGGVAVLGRMTGSAGDVMVVASRIATGISQPALLLVAYDAKPIARHVVAATMLPLSLLAIMYSLIALMYFWLHARVLALTYEQDFTALLAHDMRLPVIGLNWAMKHFVSGEKRKGLRKEELMRSMTITADVIDDWMRRIIDRAREARGGREVLLVKTNMDLREVLDRVIAVYDLYARARGIAIVRTALPDHMPIVASREAVERAMLQVFAFLVSDDAGEKIVITQTYEKGIYSIIMNGIRSFTHSPRGLMVAQDILRTQGGSLTLNDSGTNPSITIQIPRG